MLNIHQVKIRRMVAHDVEQIAQAFAHMHKTQEQYERYWQENVASQRVTLIAELEGCIGGYTNVVWRSEYDSFRSQEIPEIHDMNVVAILRRNGIGTKMVEAAEQIVRQSGKSIIGIGVGVTPDYAIAQRLYPQLGYLWESEQAIKNFGVAENLHDCHHGLHHSVHPTLQPIVFTGVSVAPARMRFQPTSYVLSSIRMDPNASAILQTHSLSLLTICRTTRQHYLHIFISAWTEPG